MSPKDVLILGGGLAGLGAARALPGAVIYEAEAEAGGHARSHEFAGAWFDRGAHICHSQDKAWLALVTAGVSLHEMTKSVVLNHKAGRWFAYPVQNHLADLPPKDRDAALAGFLEAQEQYRDREPKNYEEWCRSQYGDFLLENFYRLYTAKYWHVPMAELATDWLGGRLLPSQVETIIAGAKGDQEEKQAVFSRFRYPERGGFFALVKHLFDGIDIRFGKHAVGLDSARRRVSFSDGTDVGYEAMVATIPLPELVAMAADAPADVKAAAEKLRCLRQYCVNMVVDRVGLSSANWFYIYDPDIAVSRVSFPFSLSGEDSGRTAIQAEIFLPGDARPDEETLRDQAVADMGRLLKFQGEDVVAAEIRCYPFSYVVSDLDRAPAVAHVREWLRRAGIETAGLFGSWHYLWSDRAYASGKAAANQIGTAR